MRTKKAGTDFLFLILLLLQIANFFVTGYQKEGYYIDELWSYGLANSYYQPFLQDREDYLNEWHSSDYFASYLTAMPGENFSFDSVYDNQTKDVHPPLYYMLLHMISSCVAGQFSKWMGLIVNLLFFVGTLIVLYRISCEYLGKGRYTALLPVLIYGFSIGGMNTAMYIRMYMMLTFWTTLFLYLMLRFAQENENRGGTCFC